MSHSGLPCLTAASNLQSRSSPWAQSAMEKPKAVPMQAGSVRRDLSLQSGFDLLATEAAKMAPRAQYEEEDWGEDMEAGTDG